MSETGAGPGAQYRETTEVSGVWERAILTATPVPVPVSAAPGIVAGAGLGAVLELGAEPEFGAGLVLLHPANAARNTAKVVVFNMAEKIMIPG